MERREYKRLWMKEWRRNNRSEALEQQRKHFINRKNRLGDDYRRVSDAAIKKWRLNNPEKSSAHRKVYVELRAGRLQKQPCEVCGEKGVHAHHDDYSKPLKIRWLCPVHHGATKNLSPDFQ